MAELGVTKWLNPFTAIYKCTQHAREKYGYFNVIMVLHIISYKIITTVGIYTKFFPACLRHFKFGTMSEIMFSSDSMSKNFFFQQLKKHEWLLSFTTSLLWNGWETMVQKCENDRNFLLYHCWFQLISIVIHVQAILDLQNNLYFKETQQTNATIAFHLWKKRVFHQKGIFPCEKQAFGRTVMI